MIARTNGASHGRRSRVVLTPRRWCQVGGVIRWRRWQESPITGESTKETVKTIACGNAGCSGATVVTTRVLSTLAHEAAGAAGTRHSPRPLLFRRAGRHAKPGRMRRGIAKPCLHTAGLFEN